MKSMIQKYKEMIPAETHTIGNEYEFVSVNGEGRQVDTTPIFKELAAIYPAKVEIDPFYGSILGVGLPDGSAVTKEAGVGLLEFAQAPQEGIFEADSDFREKIRFLTGLADKHGSRLIGYGIQPVNPPDPSNWIKKRRHEIVCQNFGCNYDVNITSIASTQAHIVVEPENMALALNVFNWLSGVIIAMFANSPVWKNAEDEVRLAVRERLWFFTPDNRHGIFPGPVKSFDDMMERIFWMRHYITWDGSDYHLPKMPFVEFLRQNPKKDFARELPALLATLWYCARPTYNGTIEIRPACAQPREASMSLGAFCLGIKEMLMPAQMLINSINSDWSFCREMREIAMCDGINGIAFGYKLHEIAGAFLDLSEAGLKARGLGEEVFLQPLRKRVADRKTLAEEVIEVFRESDVPGMVEMLSY